MPLTEGLQVIVDLNQVTLNASSSTQQIYRSLIQTAHEHVPIALGVAPGSQSGLVSPFYILCFTPRSSHSTYPPMSSGPVGLSDGFGRCFLDHPWSTRHRQAPHNPGDWNTAKQPSSSTMAFHWLRRGSRWDSQ